MTGPLSGLRGWLSGRTSAQLSVAVAVLAALALSGSVVITGQAVRADQRQKAALVALADYAAMVDKLGVQAWLGADQVTEAEVLDWVWGSGVDKDETEASLATQIEEQKNPTSEAGVPW